MAIDPVSSASAAASSKAASASVKTGLDYDTFLTLLVAQMKNQDPTDPIDATEQMAQLATFSQVEQTIQTNRNLEKLLASSALSEADAVIGRTITSADGEVTGTVDEVRLTDDGIVAVLGSGKEVAIETGVTVR